VRTVTYAKVNLCGHVCHTLSLSFCPHNPCLFRPGVWLVEILIKGKIFKDAAAVAVVVAVTTAPAGRRMNIKNEEKSEANPS